MTDPHQAPTDISAARREDRDTALHVARLSLAFGRVDRHSYHDDGCTPESDTDHTVMLGLLACAFAARHPQMGLDIGLIAQFALVHDLPEIYAGDTPTLRALDADAAAAKQQREDHSAARIAEETGAWPWISNTISNYERRQLPEARYVKAMDKVLPMLTHILNDGARLTQDAMGLEEMLARTAAQDEELRGYAADFPAIFELRADLLTVLTQLLDRGPSVPH